MRALLTVQLYSASYPPVLPVNRSKVIKIVSRLTYFYNVSLFGEDKHMSPVIGQTSHVVDREEES